MGIGNLYKVGSPNSGEDLVSYQAAVWGAAVKLPLKYQRTETDAYKLQNRALILKAYLLQY